MEIKKQLSHGFTFIELLVVVALIGILAGSIVLLVDPNTQFQKSRDAQRKADLRQIQAALELYRADKGQYPPNGVLVCRTEFNDGANPPVVYMKKVPCDPSNQTAGYAYISSGNSYALIACLENREDPQKDATNTCQGGTYSYTLTNP